MKKKETKDEQIKRLISENAYLRSALSAAEFKCKIMEENRTANSRLNEDMVRPIYNAIETITHALETNIRILNERTNK